MYQIKCIQCNERVHFIWTFIWSQRSHQAFFIQYATFLQKYVDGYCYILYLFQHQLSKTIKRLLYNQLYIYNIVLKMHLAQQSERARASSAWMGMTLLYILEVMLSLNVCHAETASLLKPQVACVCMRVDLGAHASLCACQFVCVWCTIVVIMLAVGAQGECASLCVCVWAVAGGSSQTII